MKRIVIMGAGGFAREVADVLRDLKGQGEIKALGFITVDDSQYGELLNDLPVLGKVASLTIEPPLYGIAGAGEVEPRKRQVAEMTAAGILPMPAVIHPSVVMSPFVSLGDGTIVTAGSILTNNIVIGCHVLVNLGVTIGHDVRIGDHCVLSPGVHVSGWCTLEPEVYIGTGAVILPHVTVGRGSVVGAGAVVRKDVESGTTVVGVPARPL